MSTEFFFQDKKSCFIGVFDEEQRSEIIWDIDCLTTVFRGTMIA